MWQFVFLFAIITDVWALLAKSFAKHGPPAAEIFVSLMGWSGLLKGINRIVKIPVLYEYRIKKMQSTSNITGYIMIVFGSILLYGGLTN